MSRFKKECERIAESLGVEVEFFQDIHGKEDAFEDDGSLHVCKKTGERACFDVGDDQSLSGKGQNDRTRKVMEALHLKVTDRVLVDEDEDDEDCYCPHCGARR